ncbi:hypothetical protein I5I61_31565, partial [Pseudomonas nitroreducens]
VQLLADDLQAYIDTIQNLALAFRQELALDGSGAGARMGDREKDAILHAIVCTAKGAGEDLITLLDKLGVPA